VIIVCLRWYLRYCLTVRDLKEMMAERDLAVDHSTIGRWVLRYAPELLKRIRRELRPPNRSWRVDETYIRVAGAWTYLYRAVDSTGATIDFMLSPKRDLVAAKHFLQIALWPTGQIRPRVLNVDGAPVYPPVIAELKKNGELSRRCRCRPCPYLNNILEQDHRFVKKRIAASLWFRSVDRALRTIAGYEANEHDPKRTDEMAVEKDTVGQVRFVERLFGLGA
jgi:transposase, IS6 family